MLYQWRAAAVLSGLPENVRPERFAACCLRKFTLRAGNSGASRSESPTLTLAVTAASRMEIELVGSTGSPQARNISPPASKAVQPFNVRRSAAKHRWRLGDYVEKIDVSRRDWSCVLAHRRRSRRLCRSQRALITAAPLSETMRMALTDLTVSQYRPRVISAIWNDDSRRVIVTSTLAR